MELLHKEKNVLFSPYLVRMRENTDQKKLRIWTLFTQWFSFKIQLFQVGGPYHIETSQLFFRAFAESWKSYVIQELPWIVN